MYALVYIYAIIVSGLAFMYGSRVSVYFECIFSLLPNFALTMSFIKVLYRAGISERDEKGRMDIDPYGINGFLPEVIMLSLSIILYSTFIYVLDRRENRENETNADEEEMNN